MRNLFKYPFRWERLKRQEMKIAAAFVLFFITFMCFMIYLVGMHGHLMFRPHMTEDWVIWGIAAASFVGGLVLLINGVKSLTKSKGAM